MMSLSRYCAAAFILLRMPDQPTLDLATATHWLGFRPGMTQAEVRERLRQLGSKEDLYSDDNFAAVVGDRHLEFWFEADGVQRLRQIAAEGDVVWNDRPIINLPLDDALRAIAPLNRSPMWEANDATDEPFPDPGGLPVGLVKDEKLLEDGTVWLPDRGFGLVMWQGKVSDIVWREMRDLPSQFAGPVTEAQRQLSKRPDLEKYLRDRAVAAELAAGPKNPRAPLHGLLICACLGLLAYVGYRGFLEMKLWNMAPSLSGKFVSMEQVPRKKHFDLGPEFIRRHMADDPTRYREMYHLQYLDPSGRSHEATIEAAEFYVPPRELGEEVQIAYVEGDPPRVKGLSRARDAAFIEYMPWAMAVGLFYIVGLFVLGIVPLTWRSMGELLLAAFTTPNRGKNYDRP
jgi:hypothetical protein